MRRVSVRGRRWGCAVQSRWVAAEGSIPGPASSDPVLGNLGDVAAAGSLHQYLQLLNREYGPVAAFYWGGNRVVSLSSPKAFLQVGKLHSRAADLFAAFKPLLGEGSLQYQNGPVAKEKHRLMTKSFDRAALAQYFDELKLVCKSTGDRWADMCSDGPAEMQALPEAMEAGLRGIMSAAFGETTEEERNAVLGAYHACWTDMEVQLMGSMPEAGSERELKFQRSLGVLRSFAERRTSAGGGRFISVAASRDNLYTPGALLDEAITVMVGGFHTTGTLLAWLFYYLARYPDVQEELRREYASRSVGDVAAALATDTLANRVVNETLRVVAIAPWAARLTGADPVTVLGHEIPAATPVVLALGVVQQDGGVWENPAVFDPARFEAGRLRAVKDRHGPLAFVPFGFAGGRVCPGSRLTTVESVLLLAELLPRFSLSLAEPGMDPGKEYGLVTTPKKDVRIVVTPLAA
eukprot:TRINITY_DN8221_c0_g1_i1.p1 TRINITY_DN8221_c0_g1~~TRINITY_DN8221_c0_g1_i1.p1  ORF type:complete len:464 (+),score=114.61 TRINITY_DN8221_c0_g1_i1:96-1487(+)